MSDNFIDVEFPRSIGVNSEISEEYLTDIATNNFYERRNSKQTFSRLSIDLTYNVRSLQEINLVRNLHDQTRGARYSFKFLNPLNYSTKDRIGRPGPIDSKVAEFKVADRNNIQEIKIIDKYRKRIQLPYFNTLIIVFYNKTIGEYIYGFMEEEHYDNLSERNYVQSIIDVSNLRDWFPNNGYIDYQKGIYFTDRFSNMFTAYDSEDIIEIYIGCEFFNKVRFEQDRLSVVATGIDTYQISQLNLIEVFE